jgi:preprotein translocase subunit SecE
VFDGVAAVIKKIKSFFSEMAEELRKSTWPNRRELAKSTLVVVIGMVVFSFYIGVADFSLLNIVDFISECVRKS